MYINYWKSCISLFFWTKGVYNSQQLKCVSHSPVHSVEKHTATHDWKHFHVFPCLQEPHSYNKARGWTKTCITLKGLFVGFIIAFSNANMSPTENWVGFQFHLKTQSTRSRALLAQYKPTALPGVLFLNFWPRQPAQCSSSWPLTRPPMSQKSLWKDFSFN